MGTSARETADRVLHETAGDLLRYFERRVPSRADAPDLLSETLLQAWRRVDDLPAGPTERQRTWLFTIAAHVLANHRRGAVRRTRLAERLRQHVRTQSPQPDHDEAAAVRDAVHRLPSDQRELVMLVHWDGLSLAAAAEVLGLNHSTARGRYATARGALRASLSDAVTC